VWRQRTVSAHGGGAPTLRCGVAHTRARTESVCVRRPGSRRAERVAPASTQRRVRAAACVRVRRSGAACQLPVSAACC
jgi:hypothetical protein